MKKLIVVLFLFMATLSFTQQKYALVIGNSNYNGISKLNNPENDANDMEISLRNLGFTVEKILNGSLEQMENAIIDLSRRIGISRNSYGFFFFAGHGIQYGGENYLIPIEADNIRSEIQLRHRAYHFNLYWIFWVKQEMTLIWLCWMLVGIILFPGPVVVVVG